MIYDFHTHTSLSDGDLSPVEVIRRAVVNNYAAIGLTDHISTGGLERVIHEVVDACALARQYWKIMAIPGVELTHVPAKAIAETARRAKELGAWLVVVHGETIVEPVEPGTNLAALQSPHVDILAHPGLLTTDEARVAADRGIFLEISARKGHSLTNGLVASRAREAGARLILDSDAHDEGDLLTESFATAVVRGAGLDGAAIQEALLINPEMLLRKVLTTHRV